MIGDLLLAWISEVGKGRVSDFRERAVWLARTENLDISEGAAGKWLRNAASLGHCEVDWHRGVWSVAPSVISRLPSADGLAVLAGARRPRLLRLLKESEVYTEEIRRPTASRQLPLPVTILIPYEKDRDLHEAAQLVGASYVGCGANGIASILKRQKAVPTAAPSYSSELEFLANLSLWTWDKASPRAEFLVEGLYRERVNGRWRHMLRRASHWYSTDLSGGLFAELERTGDAAINWRPLEGARSGTGTVFIDWSTPLPPLQSRALVLCCGLAPRAGQTAGTLIYDNVPEEIATAVAASLGQSLIFDSR